MAPKSGKAEWKVVGADGEAEGGGEGEKRGGGKRGGKGGRGAEGAPWANRDNGKGKGGSKAGGNDDWKSGWDQGNRGRGRGRGGGGGGYQGDEDYYEGGYGYGGSGFGDGAYGYPPWHAGAQDWSPLEAAQPPPPPQPKLWTEYTSPDGTPYYYNSRTGLTQWDRPAALDPPKPVERQEDKADGDTGKGFRGPRDSDRDDSNRNAGKGKRGGDGGDRRDREGKGGDDDRQRGQRNQRKQGGGKGGGGGQGKQGQGQNNDTEFGPPGCNLFVFHLPDDWTDDDLNEYFAPHGAIMSAKVMKELGTGRSRGFGFVSYEDRVSAATAIKKMQGYKILGKRLKVEFKKGEGQDEKELEMAGEGDDGGGSKKSYPDDERLIGYLRAISAKNVVQSLKETEGADDDGDEPSMGAGPSMGVGPQDEDEPPEADD